MTKEKDSITVSIRVSKKLVKIYESVSLTTVSALMREVIERAPMNPEWIDSKIAECKGTIKALEELKKVSPLLNTREFSEEEDTWFKQMYAAAINNQDETWLLNRHPGYNINFGTELRQTEFAKLLRKWLKDNKLSMPKKRKGGESES